MPLEVEPSTSVLFPGPYTEKRKREVRVRNTGSTTLTYKLRTTVYERYNAKRHTGILAPGQSTTIDVFLKPFEYDPQNEPEHALLIRWVEKEVTTDPKLFWKDLSVTDPDCNLHKISCELEEKYAITKRTTTRTTTSFSESCQMVGGVAKRAADPMSISVASGDVSLTRSVHEKQEIAAPASSFVSDNGRLIAQSSSPKSSPIRQQQKLQPQPQQHQQEQSTTTSTSLMAEVKRKLSSPMLQLEMQQQLQQLQQPQQQQPQQHQQPQHMLHARVRDVDVASPASSPMAAAKVTGQAAATAFAATTSSTEAAAVTAAAATAAAATAAAATVASPPTAPSRGKPVLPKPRADSPVRKTSLVQQQQQYLQQREEQILQQLAKEEKSAVADGATIVKAQQPITISSSSSTAAASATGGRGRDEEMERLFDGGIKSLLGQSEADKEIEQKQKNLISAFLAGEGPKYSSDEEEEEEEKKEVEATEGKKEVVRMEKTEVVVGGGETAKMLMTTITTTTTSQSESFTSTAQQQQQQQLQQQQQQQSISISPRSPRSSVVSGTVDPLAPPRKKDELLFQVSTADGATFYAAPDRVTKDAIVLRQTDLDKKEDEEIVIAPMLHAAQQQPQQQMAAAAATAATTVVGTAISAAVSEVETSQQQQPVAPKRQTSFTKQKPELEAEVEILKQLQQGQRAQADADVGKVEIDYSSSHEESIAESIEVRPKEMSQVSSSRLLPPSSPSSSSSSPSSLMEELLPPPSSSSASSVGGRKIPPTPEEQMMVSMIREEAKADDETNEQVSSSLILRQEVMSGMQVMPRPDMAVMERPDMTVMERQDVEVMEKPKRRSKMPTAADTAAEAAAATAAAAASAAAAAAEAIPLPAPKAEKETLMISEMTKIVRVLDEKLDVLDAFELDARLRLGGVEQAVRAVERLEATRHSTKMRSGGASATSASKVVVVGGASEVVVAATKSTSVSASKPAAAATPENGETKERLDSLMSSLNLLEKSLDVLYFLEFETVNEEAQIKRLIAIADKIHSQADSKERLVSQLKERRQSLEHLEKESNIIIAKTEQLKRNIRGSGSDSTKIQENELLMRKLTTRIEESVDTLVAMETSTSEMTDKTEELIKVAKKIAAGPQTAPIAPITDKNKGKLVDEDDPKKDEEKLNLLMATLQEIGRKTTLMEEMEQDARSMLMRADDLQKQIEKFEKSKKLREEAERKAEKKVAAVPSTRSPVVGAKAEQDKESARVSIMADVQQMKEVVLQQTLPSTEIQQMKDMVQDEINQEREVEEEIKMRELLHLKEKERQKELIKQIRLMEEIEEIQEEHDREQFYHDQEQEMNIQEKEEEHERNHEHNLALMHQLELMTQINLIQDTVLMMEGDDQMDSEKERLMSLNMREIEKQLDILDEIERGTAIATMKVDSLSARVKDISKLRLDKPLWVMRNLDEKLHTLDDMERSTNLAAQKVEKMTHRVSMVSKKENEGPEYFASKIDEKLNTLDDMERSTNLAIQRVEEMNLEMNKMSKKEKMESGSRIQHEPVKLECLKSAEMKDGRKHIQLVFDEISRMEKKLDVLEAIEIATAIDADRSDTLLHQIGQYEIKVCGSTNLLRKDHRGQQISSSACKPTDLLATLSAMEKRLSCIEDLHREKHLSKDMIDSSILKVKALEAQVHVNYTTAAMKPSIPSPSPVSDDKVDKKYFDQIIPAIACIEGKVAQLEKLYKDVQTLISQAEVMGDGIKLAEKRNIELSTKVPERPKELIVGQTEVIDDGIKQVEKIGLITTEMKTAVLSLVPNNEDEKSSLDTILPKIVSIESKISELEKLYVDVQTLSSQAEVLGDGIRQAEITKNKPIITISKKPEPVVFSEVGTLEDEMVKSETRKKQTINITLEKPKQVVVQKNEKEEKRMLEKSDAYLKKICIDLDRIDNYLSMLDTIYVATAIDVDRSDKIASEIGKLEKGIKGSAEDIPVGSHICELAGVMKMPSDAVACLAAIEKRLSDIEHLKREKGIQSELVDVLISKIKKLERELNQKAKVEMPSKVEIPSKVELPSNESKMYSDQCYINDLMITITTIESKVNILEKLYEDVQTVQSQAGVLGDEIEKQYQFREQRQKLEPLELMKSMNGNESLAAEKLEGKMQNIAILEKEISDLLKESEMSSLGKRLESVEEWEVVDKQSIQEEMEQTPQQCMTSSDVAKMKVGKGLHRTFSAETTELLAKVDGMKESVEEQKALRMLERENSLELLDYGGTGGPVEQEAALLLERVDQGFTQIITDQSESHLMSSLKKELTPDRLDSDTSLAEHEKEKLHQQELIRQIQEMQHTAVHQEEMETDELIAALDEEHKLEKEKQIHLQDQSQAMLNIELMRKSVMQRQEEIQMEMEQTLNLQKDLATSELTGPIHDRQWVQAHQLEVQHQSELKKKISLMQQDSKLLDVELENIALQEKKILDVSPDLVSDPGLKKPIDVLLEQPVVHRMKRANVTQQKGEGLSQIETDFEMQGIDLNQQLRRLSVEYQKLMWEVEKQTSMESLSEDVQKGTEEKSAQEVEDIFVNLLPKGGRIDPEMAFEPIAAMRRTIANMKEEVSGQQLVMQMDFMSNCLDAVETQINHLKTEKKIIVDSCKEWK